MHTVDTTITIAAPPETVWGMIVAFDKYHEWNPFIVDGAGAPVVGSKLKLEMRPPGDKAMTHHPVVQFADEGRRLQWLGVFKSGWLFAARHEFLLEPAGAGTKMRHREYFSGILVLFLKKTLVRTEEGFHALNRALKQRAETAAGVPRVE